MRLLILFYAADYREFFRCFSQGKDETYYAQKYAFDTLIEIGQEVEELAVLCCKSTEPYNEIITKNFRAIGSGLFNPERKTKQLIKLIEEQKPTHLIACATFIGIFRWSIQKQIPTIGVLADSFMNKGLRSRIKNYLLANLLNNERIEWIGDHGINSCLSLQTIGVNPNKIIPWDWPHISYTCLFFAEITSRKW